MHRRLPFPGRWVAFLLPLAIGVPRAAVAQQPVAGREAIVLVSSPAGPASPLDRPVSLNMEGVRLAAVLDEIDRQAQLGLTYTARLIPVDRRVSIHLPEGTARRALAEVLQGIGVEPVVTPAGTVVLVRKDALPEADQSLQGTITGQVTGPGGEPLASANVVVVGTQIGTLTGADGRYTIRGVPPGTYSLSASLIGYSTQVVERVQVREGETTIVNFALQAQALVLDELVAVGYGTQQRRELTGAISSVAARDFQSAPVISVDQALLGRAAGVEVVSSSGQPGSGAAVRIRGGNSISAGNSPLYVIDGVPITADLDEATTGTLLTQGMRGFNPLAAVNPDDIESIEVLKDAAATAIYGARAANGVVLITTKRGRAGAHSVSFGAYYGVAEVRRRLPVLDAAQFAEMVNQAYINAGQPPRFSPADIASLDRGTDWQDAIFRAAPVRNFELSFSGGDEDTRYYISGSLLQSEGVIIGTNMDRGSFRLNLDQTVSSRVRIGSRLTLSRSEGQVLPNAGAGQEVPSVVLNALMAPPTLPVRNAAGEYFTDVNPLTGRPFANPVASALEITNKERQNRVVGSVYAEYDLPGGLTLRTSAGLDFLNSLQDFYSPSHTLPGRNTGGYGSRGHAQTTSWLSETTLRYARQFGGVHSVDLLGGLTLQRTRSETVSGTAQGFQTDRLGPNGLNTATTFVGIWTGAPNSSLLSYFSRLNWGIADRYLFTVTGRVDGSSKFGQGRRYGFFPSAAFAWRASEEEFVQRLGFFDELKLRASYGRTGNQDIGNYASLARLGSTVYVLGGRRAIGYVPQTLANPDLKWETTDQLDVGVDAAFFNNRVAITADYYRKKTRDLLLDVPVPTTSGFSSSLQNIGSVSNHGFELSISTVNLAGPLRWETTLNLARNRNKVLDLGVDTMIVEPVGVGAGAHQNPTVLRVGQPTNAFYGWVYAGMQDGQPVYKDLNGDGLVTESDRTIIGTAQPDYTGGLTNRFAYRNFELSVFLQWSVGNEVYNINRALLTSAAGDANQLRDVMEGRPGIPAPKIGNTFENRPSDLFIEDGSYLRGKNIRLSYTVPGSWLGQVGLGRVGMLQLYVSAQNFFTLTDYSGFDPEISEYAASNLAQGFDFGTYPQPRQITVGFKAGF